MPKDGRKPKRKKEKMNKQEISNMLDAWNFTSEAKKSVANRLESALSKTGSASSRLNMASASLAKLAESLDEDSTEQNEAHTMSAFLKFCSLVAIDNKKPATQKTKREQWHDADTPEAQAILATKSTKKSRKTDSAGTYSKSGKLFKDEELTEALREAFASMLAGR
jgi:hypothetical protein